MKRWVKQVIRSWAGIDSRHDNSAKTRVAHLRVEPLELRCMPIIGSLANAPLVARGAGYDGVVMIMPTGGWGSGSLIYTGRHILTAAHLIANPPTNIPGNGPAPTKFEMKRDNRDYDITIPVPANGGGNTFQIAHPSFTLGTTFSAGYDVAILRLTDPETGFTSDNRYLVAPYGAEKRELYAATDEVGKTFTMVGYGKFGTGATGSAPGFRTPKRIGENKFDADANLLRNEVQSVEVLGATGGTFKLSFGGATTAAIAFDATNVQIQAALEAAQDGAGGKPMNGNVRVYGGIAANGVFFVEFIGAKADSNVNEMTRDATGLVGAVGGPAADVRIRTRFNGTLVGPPSPRALAYDFDKGGSTAQDAFGLMHGVGDLGLGDTRETAPAIGDSGGPALIDGRIAGVVSFGTSGAAAATYMTPDIDAVAGNSSWGEFGVYTRVSSFVGAGKFITDTLEPAGAAGNYHIVLDMNYQVVGAKDTTGVGTPGENISITARRSGANLELVVDAPGTGYDGIYYSAPADKILSLTIRGSDDHETIRVEGPLGLAAAGSKEVRVDGRGGNDKIYVTGLQGAVPGGDIGTVYVHGGDDTDEIEISEGAAIGDGHHYTVENAPAWDMRLSRATKTGPAHINGGMEGKPAVDSYDIEKYTLYTGTGADIVRIEKASPLLNQGLFVHANGGIDEVFAGAVANGFDDLKAAVYIDGAGANARLTYLDDAGAGPRHYELKRSVFQADLWDMQLGVIAGAQRVHSKFITKYTLQATQASDIVQIDATSAMASEGTHVFGNGGSDTITVGSPAEGLANIATRVEVTGSSGIDTLIIDDRATQASKTFVILKDSVARAGGPTVFNNDTIIRKVLAGPGGNVHNLVSNAAGAESDLRIEAGAGNDSVFVSNDTTGSLDGILGVITIDGITGKDSLALGDTGYALGDVYTVKADEVGVTRLPDARYIHAAVEALALNTGAGKDKVDLDGITSALAFSTDTGAEYDRVRMVSGYANDPYLSAIEALDVLGGTLAYLTHDQGVQDMTQGGGVLDGPRNVTASTTLIWTGGTMQGTGWTNSLGTLTITGGTHTLYTRTLANYGFGLWRLGAIIGDTGTVRNYGTFHAEGVLDGTLVNHYKLYPAGKGSTGRIYVLGAFHHGVPNTLTVDAELGMDLGGGRSSYDAIAAETVLLREPLVTAAISGFPQKTYTIINNTGPSPVDGTFLGLPEGAVFTVPGTSVRYKISYVGGDGNDVVLHNVVAIRNTVWEDVNIDGKQNDGKDWYAEADVKVELFTAGGELFRTAYASQWTGKWEFVDVPVADYYLKFTHPNPSWWPFTTKDANANAYDTIDSDADPLTGRTHTFTLPVGQDEEAVNAGFWRLPAILGYVWWDYTRGPSDPIPDHNGVGIQDENPPTPWGGIGVILKDWSGAVIRTDETDINGEYFFDRIPLGKYKVEFVLPPAGGDYSYEWTRQHALWFGLPEPSMDSDVDQYGVAQPFIFDQSSQWAEADAGIGVVDYSGAEFVASPDLPRGRGDKMVHAGGVEESITRVAFDPTGLAARPVGVVAIPDRGSRAAPAPPSPAVGDARPRVVPVTGPAFITRPGVPVSVVTDPDWLDPGPVFVPHGTVVAAPA